MHGLIQSQQPADFDVIGLGAKGYTFRLDSNLTLTPRVQTTVFTCRQGYEHLSRNRNDKEAFTRLSSEFDF